MYSGALPGFSKAEMSLRRGLASCFGDSAQAGIVTQHEVAGAEGFGFEAGAVTGDEKPMADLVAEQLDGAEGREVAAEAGIGGGDGVGKHEPETVVAGRFGVVAEHADDAVAEVDGKA